MSNTPKSVGQPRKRHDTTLSQRVASAVAPDELESIRQAAAINGLSVSQYMRTAALGTATTDPEIAAQVLAAGSAIATPDPAQLELTAQDIESNSFAMTSK